MKDTKLMSPKDIAVFLGILLSVSVAGPATSAAHSVPVFSCDIGPATVEVTARGDVLHYQYGRPGSPELSLSGDKSSGTVSYHHDMWTRAEDKQLRFRNGNYSYVLFNRWSAPNYDGVGAQDRSGLLVFEGTKQIAHKTCENGGEFGSDFDLSTLPDDGMNVIPDTTETKGDAQSGSLDDTIHEFGRILSVEDGAYPMFSVTLEFPERGLIESFSLNVEAVEVDQAALSDAIGQYASIDYTSDLVPDLFDMKLAGRSVLDRSATDAGQPLKEMTGTLTGAEQITNSDRPVQIIVTDALGNELQFPYFVPAEMLVANGRQVTVYYLLRSENQIVRIELQ